MCLFTGTCTIHSPSVLKKSPESRDVYKLLKVKSAHWDNFARELDIDDNFCEDSNYEGSITTSRSKLEKVLKKWIGL